MSDALPLPPRPNLEQYKKLARDFQNACKSNDPGAVRQWAARWVEALARLHGPNWPTVQGRDAEPEKIERRWNKLKENKEHLTECSLAGAQFFVAREHGFTSWPKFARHVQELTHASSPVSAFEAAADAIINGDAPTLRQLLAGHPGLARERSTREHRSTLLHYVSANGVENFRQKTPNNIIEITNLLLDAGADVDAESDAYGGGCTTLGLVATSVHPEKAGVQIALLGILLDRGANLRHPSAGGNNHSLLHSCIANGQPAAARFLADLGATLDPETAAAVGRLDVLQSYFDESGARRPETNLKQIESGLLYACGYGRLDTARFLLDRGVDPATRDEDGQTALHWATWAPEIGAIKLLLERGAAVDARDHRFHATPLDMALWTWNNTSEEEARERCYEAIALLARAGAKLDRDHWRDPGKDSSVMLGKVDSDSRMLAALRGEMP
jgi:ankyrin repeat protein